MAGLLIALGYPHTEQVTQQFHHSLLRSQYFGAVAREWYSSGPQVGFEAARNSVVEQFLAGPHEDLLMVDSDMAWTPKDVMDLGLREQPIVGGLTFALGQGGPYPVILDWKQKGFLPRYDYRPELQRCDATGAAFLLISREVLEKIPKPWFQWGHYKEVRVDPDMWFCLQAQEFGYEIHVDAQVKPHHLKLLPVDEEYYLWKRSQ